MSVRWFVVKHVPDLVRREPKNIGVRSTTEPGEYSADLNWGDGGATVVGGGTITFNANTGNFEVRGSHTYAEEEGSPFNASVQLHHKTAANPAPTKAGAV